MRRSVNHDAMPSAGYVDPWNAVAGQRVALHLSAAEAVEELSVWRIDLPTPERIDWRVLGGPGRPKIQSIERGSWLEMDAAQSGTDGRLVSAITLEVLLTRNPTERCLVDLGPIGVWAQDGSIRIVSASGAAAEIKNVPQRKWLNLALVVDHARVELTVTGRDDLAPFRGLAALAFPGSAAPIGRISIGSDLGATGPSINARFARIAARVGDQWFYWRFPTRLVREPIGSEPSGIDLQIKGLPTFCVTSLRWDGSSLDPRLTPSHYDAIHVHDDDLGPLDWPVVCAVDVPEGAISGVYAIEIRGRRATERFIFFVRQPEPRAPLLFLVPTATYLAYADESLPPELYPWICRDRGHAFARDNEIKSLYDFHSDFSGVSIVSSLRPRGTIREDYVYPLCGCPHNFPVDLRFLRFCRANGIEVDVATDHDLHERGHELLRGRRAVVTGSHPEYLSVQMEACIRSFLAEGGSLAYLGGNGFAGVVAFKDDLLELRRSPLEALRTWDGPIAEMCLAITNEPGGQLRSRGRGEFSLVGGAISLMGFEGARPFRLTAAGRSIEYSWLFSGVDPEKFGDHGTVLGGAAGYEVDSTNALLGSPGNLVILARAESFPASYVHDPSRWYPGGEAERQARMCAEMTIRRLPSGGLVFSASSVAWCGALPDAGETNDVGQITGNLLRRLSGETPGEKIQNAEQEDPYVQ